LQLKPTLSMKEGDSIKKCLTVSRFHTSLNVEQTV
jgi:hypothetical protein